MSAGAVVIGVGSAHGDDAIGHRVVQALRGRPGVTLVTVRGGDPAALIDAWDGARVAIVVDAVRSGAPAGTVHALTAAAAVQARTAGWSSHGTGLAPAIELGRALGRLPAHLVVLGVEAYDVTPEAPMSPAVRAAVPQVLALARRELRAQRRDSLRDRGSGPSGRPPGPSR